VGEAGVSNPLIVGLSLITNPTRFRLVKGFVERLTLKEASAKYGIRYKYAVRLAGDLSKRGLLTRAKLFRYSVYVPTPLLAKAFKVACLELYRRASQLPEGSRDSYLARYGITYREVVELARVGEEVVEEP